MHTPCFIEGRGTQAACFSLKIALFRRAARKDLSISIEINIFLPVKENTSWLYNVSGGKYNVINP